MRYASVTRLRRVFCPLLLLIGGLAYGEVEAPTEVPTRGAIDFAAMRAKVEQLQRTAGADQELAPATREAIETACTAALTHLQSAAAFTEQSETHSVGMREAPERAAENKRLLAEGPSEKLTFDRSAELPTLEQKLAELEIQLAATKKRHTALLAEPATRTQRRKEIRARIAAITETIAEAGEEAPAALGPENPELTAALRAEAAARELALQRELLALQAELAKYDADDSVELVRLRTDLAGRRVAHAEQAIGGLKELVKERREAAAEESVRKARLEAVVAIPALKSYADRNHQLAETARAIAKDLSVAETELKASNEALERLTNQFRATRSKVEKVGLTSSVGALLRKQRATLPDAGARRAAIVAREPVIDETQYQLFDYGEASQELGDLDAKVREVLDEVGADGEHDPAFLESATRELLERKREYLGSVTKAYNDYFETLVDLDTTDKQVVDLTASYSEFIDARVLWIRSGKVLSSGFTLDDSDLRLTRSAEWAAVGDALVRDARRLAPAYAFVAVVFVALVFRGRRLRRHVSAVGEAAAKANCRTIRPTLNALAATVVIATVWPLLLALVGWRLTQQADAFVQAIGQGLLGVSVLWGPIELLRQMCRPKGLGEAHFGWAPAVTEVLRLRLARLLLAGLPLLFATGTLLALETTHGSDAVERVCFIAGMAVLAIAAGRAFGAGGVLREHIAYNKGGWVDRLRLCWPWLAAAAPVSLGVLAFVGYYYTAQVLSWRLFESACFLLAAYLVRALLLRSLMLRRRNLSIEQARERAAAAAAAAEQPGEGGVAGIVTATPQSDLTAHSEQTRRLVTTGVLAATAVGMWLIWVEVLPALSMLDRYPLWSNGGVVASDASPAPGPAGLVGAGAEAAPRTLTETTPESVTTLSDLALALLVAFVTFVLARNGPGLLEMSVLQQLPLEASVRYAITTLVSYAIVMLGVVASCSTIGLEWSQVQWLATALTFGLAFGLQEMFANFVAGLIILLERPIRVGDIVTVDDVTGVVSRIRIRATSITNWDRKEYVVPNKEFITGRLLNWTLSDKINRIVINVGVAYGSDTEKAREILLGVANDHPLILKDPPSLATFEGFGDNSLNLVLRTYLPSLDDRLNVIHQLHTQIDQAFRREGIEIAFPQRDLHIRSAPAALGLVLENDQRRSIDRLGEQEAA